MGKVEENMRNLLKEDILNYLSGAVEKNKYIFKSWFVENGDAYYFLFKKNLRVTNIQFSELTSLVRLYSKRDGNDCGAELLFINVQQFEVAFFETMKSFVSGSGDGDSDYDSLSELLVAQYFDLMKNIVLLDVFYGSCVVYLPPGIDIDLRKICAYSGYIQSCGVNLYTRNVVKADKVGFVNVLRRYLEKSKKHKKIFFTVYAHEDFSGDDREWDSELKNGLDDVKVYVEKYYMKGCSLVSLMNYIKEVLGEELYLPGAGSYKIHHNKPKGVDKDVALWLVIDKSVDNHNTQHPGRDKYYICYEQRYVNENPLHIFDETKPAWKSSTTLPHTLASAMINIAKGQVKKTNQNKKADQKIRICDPFMGTGTIYMECLKYDDVQVFGYDKYNFSNYLLRDNLHFFSLEPNALIDLMKGLALSNENSSLYDRVFSEVFSFFAQYTEMGEFDVSDEECKKFNQFDYETMMVLYLIFRVKINSLAKIERGSSDFETVYNHELKSLDRRVKKMQEYIIRRSGKGTIAIQDNIIEYIGKYSRAVTLNEGIYGEYYKRSRSKRKALIGIQDISQLTPNYYDIIVTDPPYGFNNTAHDVYALSDLYSKMINSIIRSLKNYGQVVMCLPDRSYSGKLSPFFTHKELVIQEFMMRAKHMNIDCRIVRSSQNMVHDKIFKVPYYWDSERALRRSIVHLCFERK
ncbi:MAG: hypothetical protein HGA52_04670 [Bacteroidales bacterium]|nr:hypothetical protein [Bacteroidales bacterium]